MATYAIEGYEPHPGQLELHRATDKEILVVSSIRAGKSFGIIHDAIVSAWNNPTEWATLITAPTYRLVDSVLERPIVKQLYFMGLLREHSFSRHESTLKNGKVVYYRSLDDPDLALRGLSIHRAYIDEAAYCSKYAVDLVKGRLLTSNGQLIMITTPNGQTSWMYNEYIVEKNQVTKYIKFKLQDNPIITQEAIERLYASYDPLLAKQELEGEWVNLFDSQVYYAFSDDNIGKYELQDGQVYIGLDFNIDKNAWVAIQKLPNNTFKVIREGFGAKTTADVARDILSIYGPAAIVIPDATGTNRLQGTGKTNFQLLRQAGLTNLVEKRSNPPRQQRFAVVNATFKNALNQNRLFIDVSCKRTIRELRELSYKEKTDRVDDKGGELAHITDALGYAIMHLTGKSVGRVLDSEKDYIANFKAKKRALEAFSL